MSEPKYEHLAFLKYEGPKSDKPEIFQVALREQELDGSWIYCGFFIDVIEDKNQDPPYVLKARRELSASERELSPLEKKASIRNINPAVQVA